MLMFPTLRMQILAAVSLVLALLAQPALAQPHIRGTVTGIKDDTITMQAVKGGTENIKLAPDVAFFLVNKSDMKAVQPGKFVGITSVERGGKRVASRCTSLPKRCAVSVKVITPGTSIRIRT